MLRVNVGLSRKLSKDYNSTGFSINVDGEITAPVSDAEAVVEQVKELFDLAEEALSQQIERTASDAAIGSRDEEPARPAPLRQGRGEATASAHNGNGHHGNGNGHTNGRREDEPATDKQVSYLLSIGKRQRLTTAQLEAKIADILGREVGLYELTKQSAATVIDVLTKGQTSSQTTGPSNGVSHGRANGKTSGR